MDDICSFSSLNDGVLSYLLFWPCQARANITEVHFFPFNPVDKRTAITYLDSNGNWFRVSKGAPDQVLLLQLCTVSQCINPKPSYSCLYGSVKIQSSFVAVATKCYPSVISTSDAVHLQILNLCYNKDDIAEKVQIVVDRFAERGLRSLAVSYQVPHGIQASRFCWSSLQIEH